jgi:hypothetical protein
VLSLPFLLALATPLEADVQTIVEGMTYPGMSVEVFYEDCGVVNAYYYPFFKAVVLCNELMKEDPGFVRFVVAHEMAHAVIWQLDIPYTGSGEDAADELASLVLGHNNMMDDILAAALYFAKQPKGYDPAGEHAPNPRRAYTLACLADGAEEKPVRIECSYKFRRAAQAWTRLLP